MNPALFYRRRDKTILPADLLATYLTYHANKAEDMKLLFQIRLLEREEKVTLREIKLRKNQLEEELKKQEEDYFGCHRVFSDQSLISVSDSFKKNLYLGPYPTKGIIPDGRLKELREKLRAMPTEDEIPKPSTKLKLTHAMRRKRYSSAPPASEHMLVDKTGVIEPVETLVGRESMADSLEKLTLPKPLASQPCSEQIKSPDEKLEMIDQGHEIQEWKFKRIQSAPMIKQSREKTEVTSVEEKSQDKWKSIVKSRRAKTCPTRRERIATSIRLGKEHFDVQQKPVTVGKTKDGKLVIGKERPWSDGSRKRIGKRRRPKSSPFLSTNALQASGRLSGASTHRTRARSAISDRQKQVRDLKEKFPKISTQDLLEPLDTSTSSTDIVRDDKVSPHKEVLREEKPGIMRKRPVARLNFSKAHRLVCKSFAENDEVGRIDEENIVSHYFSEDLLEEKSIADEKQREEKRESRDDVRALTHKDVQLRASNKTQIRIEIPQDRFGKAKTEGTAPKTLAEKTHIEKRKSVLGKDSRRFSVRRQTDEHVADHADKEGECKRFIVHQAAKKTPEKKHKLSMFKTRSMSQDLRDRQSEVESKMRKKVLKFISLYEGADDEERKTDNEQQQDKYK